MNPGYIEKLYRYAIRTKGPKSIWKELAEIFNLKSDTPAETHPTIDLSSKVVNKWFNNNGGKQYQQKKNLQIAKKIALFLKTMGHKILGHTHMSLFCCSIH